MMDTIIVVPCYNEEQRLPVARFEDFLRKVPDLGFILVDDGSRDGTLGRLRSLEKVAPERVRVLALSKNAGKAEAVRLGVLRASELGVAYVGFWDADLATPLGVVLDFRRLLAERPDLEMVFGARVLLLGRNIQRNALRHYLGRVGATAISSFLRLAVYDTQCGAKLFRATPEMRACFEEPFVSRWLFDVEIRVYPGFPTLFWGLSVFFVGDLMGKALWKLVENAARFPRRGGRVLCVHGAVSFHRARPCGPRWLPGRGAMRHVELDRRVLGLQSTGE